MSSCQLSGSDAVTIDSTESQRVMARRVLPGIGWAQFVCAEPEPSRGWAACVVLAVCSKKLLQLTALSVCICISLVSVSGYCVAHLNLE